MFLVETCNPTGEDSQKGRRSDLAHGKNVSKPLLGCLVALLLYADGTIHHDSLTLYRGYGDRVWWDISAWLFFLELNVTKNSEKGTTRVTRI